jgi:hypothetical protein
MTYTASCIVHLCLFALFVKYIDDGNQCLSWLKYCLPHNWGLFAIAHYFSMVRVCNDKGTDCGVAARKARFYTFVIFFFVGEYSLGYW